MKIKYFLAFVIVVIKSRFKHKTADGTFVFRLKLANVVIFLPVPPFIIHVFWIAPAMFEQSRSGKCSFAFAANKFFFFQLFFWQMGWNCCPTSVFFVIVKLELGHKTFSTFFSRAPKLKTSAIFIFAIELFKWSMPTSVQLVKFEIRNGGKYLKTMLTHLKFFSSLHSFHFIFTTKNGFFG